MAGDLGHRDAALDRLHQAAELDAGTDLRQRLRRETIAALARGQARRVTASLLPFCEDPMQMSFDRRFERCALVAKGVRGVGIYRVSDGTRLRQLEVGLPDEIPGFGPDGRHLLLRYRGSLAVVGVETGSVDLAADGGDGVGSNAGGFSEDGRWFARGETGGVVGVYAVPAESGVAWHRERSWRVPRRQRVGVLAWSPKEPIVALTLEDGTLAVCDAMTGEVRWERSGIDAWSLAWNGPQDTLAYHAPPNRVLILSAKDGTEVWGLTVPDDFGSTMAFSSDGSRMATGSDGLGTHLFDPVRGESLGVDGLGSWHLHFDAEGLRVGTLFDAGKPAWLVWEPSQVMVTLQTWSPAWGYQALAFDREGTRLLSRTADGFLVWRLPEGIAEFRGVVPGIRDAVFDGDPSKVLVAVGGEIRSMLGSGTQGGPADGGEFQVMASGKRYWTVARAPGRGWVAAADMQGGVVTVVDAEGKNRRDLGPLQVPGYVAFSPDDRWLACGVGTRVHLWELDHLERAPGILEEVGEVIRFSEDGRWLLTMGRRLALWEVEGWKQVEDLPLVTDHGAGFVAAISPDGRWLAYAYKRIDTYGLCGGPRRLLGRTRWFKCNMGWGPDAPPEWHDAESIWFGLTAKFVQK